MDYESFAVSLDYSKSQQEPPEMIKRIMSKAAFQPAFLLEEARAFPCPDTLEITFPEMEAEEGTPQIWKQDLIHPGSPYPLPDEDIDRYIVHDLQRKSIYIPTLFFIYEQIVIAFIAGEIYGVGPKDHQELSQKIEHRNAEVQFQTPNIEIAKMIEQRNERERIKSLEAAERALRVKESEETQKAQKGAKLENLLNLPEQDAYSTDDIVTYLAEAGIKRGKRAVEKQLKKMTRDEPESFGSGTRYQADRKETKDILRIIWDIEQKKK